MKKSDLIQEWPIKCRDHIDEFAESIWKLREAWESVKIPPPKAIIISQDMATQIKHVRHPAIQRDNYRAHNDFDYAGTVAGIDLVTEKVVSQNRLRGKSANLLILDDPWNP